MDRRKKRVLHFLYSFLFLLFLFGLLNSCQTAGRRPDETAPKKVQPAEAPRNIDKAVKENPHENLPQLIEYIRENSGSEPEMFRYAHDWVAQNVAYDVAALRGESRKVTDAYGVLQFSGRKNMLMSARLVAYPDRGKELQGYDMLTREASIGVSLFRPRSGVNTICTPGAMVISAST